MAIDPGTVGLINTGISLVSKIFGGGVDTMKHHQSCGLMLNSGNVDKLERMTLPPLTTKFRGSVKTKVNGKQTNGRTWQECVMARTIFPSQITGPMASPDMVDYLPGVADANGVIPVPQPQTQQYTVADPGAAAQGVKPMPTIKDVSQSRCRPRTVQVSDIGMNSPLMIAIAAGLVFAMVMK